MSATASARARKAGPLADHRPAVLAALPAIAVLVIGIPWVQANHLWPFVVTGVTDGSIYALAALGLVLTFKTSGVFNFAIGAQAAASAYVFYSFRVDAGMPWPIAALLSLLLVGVVGSLVLERLALWLAEAPAVRRVVATIGLLVLLQSLLTGLYGTATIAFDDFLPTGLVEIGSVNVGVNQMIVVALAIVATIGLFLFFKSTRLGISMQAVVDDSNLLALQGTNPVKVRRYAWAIGSSFVSISGMLVAPAIGIDVNQLLVLFIAAFGAAAVASFSSLPLAFASAMVIGVSMNLLASQLTSNQNLTISAFYTQVPFLVLVAALALLPPRRLVERGARRVRRARPIRAFPRQAVYGTTATVVAVALLIPDLVGPGDLTQYTTGVGFVVIFMSLGLLLWTSGQISLCHMAFAAVGATSFAHAQHNGVPWLLAMLFAVAVTVPVGAIVAIPSFRLTGTYLAVITFGVGLLFQKLLYGTFLMFGKFDNQQVTRPDALNMSGDRGYYYLSLAVAGVCALAVVAVRRSRLGRLLRGLADSPVALDAHGANTRLTRLFVFCISAAMAAVGGVLIAGVTTSASGNPSGSFGYFNSLVMVAVLTFCGRQPLLSPIAAAFLFVVLKIYPPFDSGFFVDYQGVFFGALALAVAVVPGIARVQPSRRGALRTPEGGPVRARRDLQLRGAWV